MEKLKHEKLANANASTAVKQQSIRLKWVEYVIAIVFNHHLKTKGKINKYLRRIRLFEEFLLFICSRVNLLVVSLLLSIINDFNVF